MLNVVVTVVATDLSSIARKPSPRERPVPKVLLTFNVRESL